MKFSIRCLVSSNPHSLKKLVNSEGNYAKISYRLICLLLTAVKLSYFLEEYTGFTVPDQSTLIYKSRYYIFPIVDQFVIMELSFI